LAVLASEIDTVLTGSLVTEICERAGGVEIITSVGRVSAGSVVFATGGLPPVRGLGLDLPGHRVRGHILVTAATQQAMPGAVAPVAARLPDGRLLVGGTEDVDDRDEVDPEIVRVLRAWLDGMIPAARRAATTHTWSCFRPAHPDHLPVVDRVPDREKIWFTSGHYRTGILMAPATGDALAEWIRSGERPRQVAEIGASRFAGP
jgi:glycine oxidase